MRKQWDLLAAAAAAIALIMLGVYIGLIAQQGGDIAAWFVAGLAVAALLALYGIARSTPARRWALGASGAVMVVLGLAGILSIGFPIVCAGGLAIAAAVRAG